MAEITIKDLDPALSASVTAPAAHPAPYSKIKERLKTADLTELFLAMTPKQRGFALAMQQTGMTKSQAYRLATGSKAKAETVSVQAYKMSNVHNVRSYLQESQQRQWTGALTDAPEIRQTVLRVLRDVALNGDRENNRINAAIALGKVGSVGLFSERREIIHRTEGALDTQLELRSRLEALLGPAQVIDTKAIEAIAEVPNKGTDAEMEPESPAAPESPAQE